MEGCPYIDRIETHALFRPRFMGQAIRFLEELRWAMRVAWPRRFDLAIVIRRDFRFYREAALAYLSGAQMRVGPIPRRDETRSELDDREEELLYTHPVVVHEAAHEVENSFEIIRAMGGVVSDDGPLEVWLNEESGDRGRALLPLEWEGGLRVAMMVGSSVPGRRWPEDRFAEVAHWLITELGARIVLIGAKGEMDWARTVEEICGESSSVVNLTGQTSLMETMGVVDSCEMYVGNDTGPMHIAAALGLSILEISCHPATGSEWHVRSPVRFGPWTVPHRIARPLVGADNCVDMCVRAEQGKAHCILEVSVAQVIGLISELVSECGWSPTDSAVAAHTEETLGAV